MNTLLEHIYVEFRLGKKFSIDQWHLLHESDGQVYNIDEITESVSNFLSKQQIGEEETRLSMTQDNFNNLNELPFDNIHIEFFVSINPNKQNYRKGNYTEYSQPRYPVIMVMANGETMDELIHQCNKAICHELIHGNENTGLITNTKKSLFDIHKKNDYNNYVSVVNNNKITDKEVKDLFKFLYWTDFGERKAFVGTLYGELLKYKGQFFDSEKAYEILHKTEAWAGFKKWEGIVEKLNSYLGNLQMENHILSLYNKYVKKTINNYPTFLQMINRRWRKMKNTMEEKAARILYRVYTETDGFGGEIEIGEY